MPSYKVASAVVRRCQPRTHTTRRAFERVRISGGLIAFYPQAIHRVQPYVILLDSASGILKRLNLQTAK
jgi:hypothetical protein